MDANERRIIEELFGKLRTVEGQGAARDPDAEAFIAERLRAQPGAAYYMAQTIIVQEKALEKLQAQGGERREESGGFLSGLFGGGRQEQPARQAPARGGPWGGGQPQRGGGRFLAGAAQTAVGVAGGVVAGSLLMDAFTTSPAEAAAAEADSGATEAGADDSGGNDGDFGGGDFGDI